MARRKHSGEINIGSDSFLDVIANIVGVLIILIVIAGIRASQAPVILKPARAADSIVQATPERAKVPEPATQPEPEPEIAIEPEFIEQTSIPADLAEKIHATQNEIAALQTAITDSESQKQALERRQAEGEVQISDGRNNLLTEKQRYEKRKRGLDEVQILLAGQKRNLERLQQELAALEKKTPAAQTIKHRVTPLSRAVQGDQVHFRLINNRVSQVPIHELLEAAMRQAKRHVDELAKNRTHIGKVGPLKGYFLQYKLAAFTPTPAEAAEYGRGMVRIGLRSFELTPDSELQEESADEALTRGSNFDLAAQTAEPGSTFTLWVYPDSFPLYRQLQTRLHDAGFIVAGRPLPMGIPIAGSPEGSASAGQ